MPGKESELIRTPREVYPDSGSYELAIFDLRIPGVAESLHGQRAAWQGNSDIEALDRDHFVLIVRAGGAHGE